MRSARRSIILIILAVILAVFSIPFLFYAERRFYYARLEKYLEDHAITEDVSIVSGSSRIGLNPGPDPLLFYACIPSEMTMSQKMDISFAHIHSLSIGDTPPFCSGDAIWEAALSAGDEPQPMRIYGIGGEVLYDGYIRFLFADSVPTVYITASENALPTVDATPDDAPKKYHADIRVTVVSPDGTVDTVADGEIFRHGNTSFDNFDLKPYNINFNSVQGPLGMSSSRKWVLKSNGQYETVLLKNEAAFETARMTGALPVPDSRYVNVYINGIYKGFYSLCQRISVPDMPGLSHVTALYERDFKYPAREHGFMYRGRGISILYPDSPTEDEASALADLFLHISDEVSRGPGGGKSRVDLRSFMWMYILQDLFVQTDIDNDSFYVSLDDDGKLHAGPVWDFDCSMGHITTGPYHEDLSVRSRLLHDRGMVFLKDLGSQPDFMTETSRFYRDRFSSLLHGYIEGKLTEDVAKTESSRYMSSLVNGMTPIHRGTDDDPERMLDFMRKRADYLDAYYSDPSSFIPVTYHFAWGDMTIGVEKGSPIGPMPHEAEDDTEDFWGEILGYVTAEGDTVDGSFIPEGPTDIYTVYDKGAYAWQEYAIPFPYSLAADGSSAADASDEAGSSDSAADEESEVMP